MNSIILRLIVLLNSAITIILYLEDSCKCKGKNIVLRTFKVSKSRTLLVCTFCDGIVAEWIDKIYPPNKRFEFENTDGMN